MPRKPKYRPKVIRVKLNPEQAVLTCSCYSNGFTSFFAGQTSYATTCVGFSRQFGGVCANRPSDARS